MANVPQAKRTKMELQQSAMTHPSNSNTDTARVRRHKLLDGGDGKNAVSLKILCTNEVDCDGMSEQPTATEPNSRHSVSHIPDYSHSIALAGEPAGSASCNDDYEHYSTMVCESFTNIVLSLDHDQLTPFSHVACVRVDFLPSTMA
jgi:hypothetical protein